MTDRVEMIVVTVAFLVGIGVAPLATKSIRRRRRHEPTVDAVVLS